MLIECELQKVTVMGVSLALIQSLLQTDPAYPSPYMGASG